MRNRVQAVEVPLAVAIGGALGSLARWGIASIITATAFPLATFIANIVGSFALGIVLVAGERIGHRHGALPIGRLWRPFMATGVLGGFTTFSTFVLELNRIEPLMAAIYFVSSVGLGLLAYSLGNTLARKALQVTA